MSIFDTDLVEKEVDISDDAYRFELVVNHLVSLAQDRAMCFCFEHSSHSFPEMYMERVKNELSWYLEGIHDGITPIDIPNYLLPVNRVLEYKVNCELVKDSPEHKILITVDYMIDVFNHNDLESAGTKSFTLNYTIDSL